MFYRNDEENEVTEWKLREEEIKTIEGFDKLSEEEIDAVLNFLTALAKLEIKIGEM